MVNVVEFNRDQVRDLVDYDQTEGFHVVDNLPYNANYWGTTRRLIIQEDTTGKFFQVFYVLQPGAEYIDSFPPQKAKEVKPVEVTTIEYKEITD